MAAALAELEMIDRPALEAALAQAEPPELSQLAGELQHRAVVDAMRATVAILRDLPGRDAEREDLDPLLTIPEAAKQLGVSKAKAYEMARRGDIPTVGIGRNVRVRRSALARWIKANEAGGR